MKIIVSGASGFVGSTLVAGLRRHGHEVATLVRRAPADPTELRWDPAAGELDPAALAGADAVVNLNGRSISSGRWTPNIKDELRSSRLDSTRTLVRAMAGADPAPPLLVNASATGFYGDRGDEPLDESSPPGRGFLAELCREWEAAALEATTGGARVVLLRLGMVLGSGGGALERMLTPFKLGVGGPIGSGRQFWPWIAIDDVVGAVEHLLGRGDVEGPVNLVAPGEATSRGFARALGEHLDRPAVMPAPAFAVRLGLGEMADALLLASSRVRPAVLETSGYRFRAPALADAFHTIIG
ncbi:MAG: TIGR01777 family oxidoreductase [Thermoanaerobaculales bacterium]|jgi:hypothetical protein|nr:TIGR01777 family oxidoreductase [Thermoanaerobaculales bacterium]